MLSLYGYLNILNNLCVLCNVLRMIKKKKIIGVSYMCRNKKMVFVEEKVVYILNMLIYLIYFKILNMFLF